MGLVQKLIKHGVTYEELRKEGYSLRNQEDGIFYFSNNYIPLFLSKFNKKYFL